MRRAGVASPPVRRAGPGAPLLLHCINSSFVLFQILLIRRIMLTCFSLAHPALAHAPAAPHPPRWGARALARAWPPVRVRVRRRRRGWPSALVALRPGRWWLLCRGRHGLPLAPARPPVMSRASYLCSGGKMVSSPLVQVAFALLQQQPAPPAREELREAARQLARLMVAEEICPACWRMASNGTAGKTPHDQDALCVWA